MATQTTRKQTPAQARKAAIESDFAPLYAVAGLTDLLQEAATQRLTALRTRQAELQGRVRGGADELIKFVGTIPAQVKSLPEQVKVLPSTARTQVSDAQQQAGAFASEASGRYADLAGRGKRAVDGVLTSARQVRTQADEVKDDVVNDVTDTIDPALAKAQDAVADVRKKVTGRSATPKQQPRKSAAQKSATQKSATAKKTTAKKAPAKKAPAEAS